MRLGITLLTAFFGFVFPQIAQSASYPQRTVTIVVPYAAGGPTDAAARLIAQQLSTRLNGTFIVENRTGGGGNIGNAFVAHAEPDGYTLLLAAAPIAINKTLYKKLAYDPEQDFKGVALIATAPLILLAKPDLPVSSVKELVALAKTKQLNYMSQGIGSAPHIGMELLKKKTGIPMTHVPYRGSAPALNDLMAGQVDVGFDSLVVGQPLVAGGRLKALAVTGSGRAAALPSVPTMAEAGFPDVDPSVWYGISAPAKTPDEIVNALGKAIVESLNDPELRKRFEALGANVSPKGPVEFKAFLASETAKWGEAVIASGATVE